MIYFKLIIFLHRFTQKNIQPSQQEYVQFQIFFKKARSLRRHPDIPMKCTFWPVFRSYRPSGYIIFFEKNVVFFGHMPYKTLCTKYQARGVFAWYRSSTYAHPHRQYVHTAKTYPPQVVRGFLHLLSCVFIKKQLSCIQAVFYICSHPFYSVTQKLFITR